MLGGANALALHNSSRFFDGTNTVEFTVLFDTTVPQVSQFYCMALAHNNQSSNAACTI